MHRATVGAVSSAKASGRGIIRRGLSLRRRRGTDTEELAVKTAPTKCTGQPWERCRPRSFQADGSFGAGKHLGDLRGTQMPKSSRSRPLLRNVPSNRGSGLDREAFRQIDHSARVVTEQDLRGTDTEELAVKTAPTKCTGDRGSGLDRERLRRRTAPSSSKCPPLFARRLSSRSLNDHMDHQSPLVAIHR